MKLQSDQLTVAVINLVWLWPLRPEPALCDEGATLAWPLTQLCPWGFLETSWVSSHSIFILDSPYHIPKVTFIIVNIFLTEGGQTWSLLTQGLSAQLGGLGMSDSTDMVPRRFWDSVTFFKWYFLPSTLPHQKNQFHCTLLYCLFWKTVTGF